MKLKNRTSKKPFFEKITPKKARNSRMMLSAQDSDAPWRNQGDTHQHPSYLSHQPQPAGDGEGRDIP